MAVDVPAGVREDRPADEELVRAALAGDPGAYASLYDRYAPLVRAVCHDATRDLHEAQDLSQEVFLRAYGKLGRLREPERFAAWVYAIARHACTEWRRRRGRERRRRSPDAADLDGRPAPQAPDGPSQEEEGRRLLDEIAELPESERLALHLYYLQEQPPDAARRTLGLSRSGFYRALGRARQRLRRALGGAGE